MPKQEKVSTIAHVNPEQLKRCLQILGRTRHYNGSTHTGRPISSAIVSPPGMGKSSIVEQFVEELNEQAKGKVSIRTQVLSTMRPEDMGIPDFKDGGKVRRLSYAIADWLPLEGDLPDDSFHVLFLDEFDRAEPAVQQIGLQLTLDGHVLGHRLSRNVMVVLAMNASTDIYTHNLSAAQRNRLCFLHLSHEIRDGVDQEWDEWASGHGVTTESRAFKAFRPFVPEVREEEYSFRSDRSLVQADRITRALRDATFPTADIELPLIGGVLGYAQAVEYITFHKRANEMPDIEKSLKDPENCRVPGEDKPDVQAAFVFALASRQYKDTKTLDAAITLMTRMTKPMCAMGFRAIAKGNSGCITRPIYQKWASAHMQQIS